MESQLNSISNSSRLMEKLPLKECTIRLQKLDPDPDLCLKHEFVAKIWEQWIALVNTQRKMYSKRLELVDTDILKLTEPQLCTYLSLFVRRARSPNGHLYLPHTVFYLCLGIRQYLIENQKPDIFQHPHFCNVQNALNKAISNFPKLLSLPESSLILIKEELLWERKLLGSHLPHVLLPTVMYIMTKYFNIKTVEQHMQLTFANVKTGWTYDPNISGDFCVQYNKIIVYSDVHDKMYKAYEDKENPIRCPLKIFQTYISRCCQASVYGRGALYLQPGRSCSRFNNIWYTNEPLSKENLQNMLNWILMIQPSNNS